MVTRAVSGRGGRGEPGGRGGHRTHLDRLVRGSRITRHSFTSPNWPKYSRSPSVTTHPPSDQPRPGALPPPPPSFAPGDPSAALPPPRQAARARSPLPAPPPLHSPGVPVEPSWRPPGPRGGKGRAGLEWGTAPVGFPPLREPPYKSLSRRCERSWSCRWRVPGAQPAPPMPPEPPLNCSPTRAGPCALAKRAALSGSPGRGAEEGTRAPGVSRAQGRAGASGAGAPQGVQGGGAGPAGAPRAGSPCVVCQLSPPMNILLREEQRHKGPA